MSAPIQIDGPYRSSRARRAGRLARVAWGGMCCAVLAVVLGLLSIVSGTCSK